MVEVSFVRASDVFFIALAQSRLAVIIIEWIRVGANLVCAVPEHCITAICKVKQNKRG